MNIGISAPFIYSTPAGGANVMIRNLADGMAISLEEQDTLRIFANDPTLELSRRVRVQSYPSIGSRNRFVQDTAYLPWYARTLDAVLFGNYFTPPVVGAKRAVTIIHDLQQHHFPENFSSRKILFQRASQSFTIRKANAVVVPSQFTKDDLLSIHGAKHEDRVFVIPNPIAWERFGRPNSDDGIACPIIPNPYVLSVCAHYPHKNLETLIRAFAMLAKSDHDLRLVLVGQLAANLPGTQRKSSLPSMIEDLHLSSQVIVTGFVDDETLGKLYRDARVFVFPSLFEGFGMPPVEALGLGIPVLASNRGSLLEVTMGYAHYLSDPRDPVEIAHRLTKMLDDPASFAPTLNQISEIRRRYASPLVGAQYLHLLAHP